MSYSFAGTSVLKGELKVRFANSDARAKQLAKLGDTDVNIVQLPRAMDKAEAVAYLLESGFAKDVLVRAALEAEVAPRAKTVRTVKVRAKSVKPKAKAAAQDPNSGTAGDSSDKKKPARTSKPATAQAGEVVKTSATGKREVPAPNGEKAQ